MAMNGSKTIPFFTTRDSVTGNGEFIPPQKMVFSWEMVDILHREKPPQNSNVTMGGSGTLTQQFSQEGTLLSGNLM